MSNFEFRSVPTFRDLQGRFAQGSHELLEARRDAMRTLGRRWVDLAREEAPRRTGAFVESLGFRTFNEGDALGFRAYMAQPLGDFIVLGTRPHVIVPRNARALRFEIGGQVIFASRVRHPGTRPNRFTTRAYQRWMPEARAELRKISTRYVRVLQGQSRGGQA